MGKTWEYHRNIEYHRNTEYNRHVLALELVEGKIRHAKDQSHSLAIFCSQQNRWCWIAFMDVHPPKTSKNMFFVMHKLTHPMGELGDEIIWWSKHNRRNDRSQISKSRSGKSQRREGRKVGSLKRDERWKIARCCGAKHIYKSKC